MPIISKQTVLVVAALGLAGAGALAAFVTSGVYGIGADDPHTAPVSALLARVRENAIAARAKTLTPPADLEAVARIRSGAGNYAAMCAGCHRVPGGGDTELSRGLYPAPPDLTREAVDAREAFWVIKHGIKGSGMPAWGPSMDDASVWNLAAFVHELPRLDRARYDALVAASGGHAHAAGDSGHGTEHPHDAAAPSAATATPQAHDHADAHEHEHAPPATPSNTTHRHADGSLHDHAASPAKDPPAAAPVDTGAAHDDDHHH